VKIKITRNEIVIEEISPRHPKRKIQLRKEGVVWSSGCALKALPLL